MLIIIYRVELVAKENVLKVKDSEANQKLSQMVWTFINYFGLYTR